MMARSDTDPNLGLAVHQQTDDSAFVVMPATLLPEEVRSYKATSDAVTYVRSLPVRRTNEQKEMAGKLRAAAQVAAKRAATARAATAGAGRHVVLGPVGEDGFRGMILMLELKDGAVTVWLNGEYPVTVIAESKA